MAEENNEEKSEEKSEGGGINKVFLIIGAIVLVLLISVVGVITMLLSGDEKEQAQNPQNIPAIDNKGGGMDDGMRAVNVKINKAYLKVGTLYEMPLFIANLISRKGKRYLRVKINLEMDNDALMGELDTKKAVISDIILSIITSKTVEDLSSIKGKARTKQELAATINKSLTDGKIKNIFFTEFIIQ